MLACSLLAGCSASPSAGPLASSRETAVIEANRRADAYVRGGNLESAARFYREALRLAQAVEDVEGIATNAINLSIVLQRLGKRAEARTSLEPLLGRSSLSFPSERLAQAALRRAVLDLEDRDFSGATEWIDRAESHCGHRGCALSGAIHNVKGQLALESGRLDAAVASAKAALGASRSSGDRSETANALRLLGVAAIRAGDPAAASGFLGEALAIDRQLGISHKIYLDLIGLGRASTLRGERGAARSFYERAVAVGRADRNARGVSEARALMDALGDTSEPQQTSARPSTPARDAGQ